MSTKCLPSLILLILALTNRGGAVSLAAVTSLLGHPPPPPVITVPTACKTYNNENGSCVPYYQCNYNFTSDPYVLDTRVPHFCQSHSHLDMCCPYADIIPNEEDPLDKELTPINPETELSTPSELSGTSQPVISSTTQAAPSIASSTTPASPSVAPSTTQASPSVAPSTSQPTPSVASITTQPTPSVAPSTSQPTPSVASITTQPTPSVAPSTSQPTPSVASITTQPTPSEASSTSQATPHEASVTNASLQDLPQREGCGWRNPKGVGVDLAGDNEDIAKYGEFPWVVAVLKVEPKEENQTTDVTTKYLGGGSLIHRRVVLTTAHLLKDAEKFRIRAGEWDTQSTKELHPYQERDVESFTVHKDYARARLYYDVALLFLTTPVDPAPHIGVACLPPPGVKAQPGARCFANGWGKTRFDQKDAYQAILKKVEVPAVEHRTCRDQLRKTRLGHRFELHDTFMCAGGEPDKDTCTGDGGSPLVCPMELQEGRYVQNGMVAWGIGCGQDGTPGVYVDVSVMRNWIDDKVLGKGIDELEYSKY